MTGDADRSPNSAWPSLLLPEWDGTCATILQWSQVVGKVRLALEPMLNHWWQVALYLTSRGLTTSPMPVGDGRGLEIQFDFVDGQLLLEDTEGRQRSVELKPQSVADFFHSTMEALHELGVSVKILPRPVEMPVSTPFAENTAVAPYGAEAARGFWSALLQAHRVMTVFRSRFVGKASPVHFFWGAADLAVTRFSGRRAPRHPGGVPNCADWVQEIAYSHEVSSAGFWPGGGEEGLFYAYAYPEPAGFSDWAVEPGAARYDPDVGEFILPYAAVRTAGDPDATLLAFLQSTYEAAAELGHWNRNELEVL